MRVGAQCANSSSGVRKIAPPVPVRPDTQPMAAPASSAAHSGGGATCPLASTVVARPAVRHSCTAAASSTSASSRWYHSAGNCRRAAKYAQGTEATTKGSTRRQGTRRAMPKRAMPMPATRMLSASAVGLTTAAGIDIKAIAAM